VLAVLSVALALQGNLLIAAPAHAAGDGAITSVGVVDVRTLPAGTPGGTAGADSDTFSPAPTIPQPPIGPPSVPVSTGEVTPPPSNPTIGAPTRPGFAPSSAVLEQLTEFTGVQQDGKVPSDVQMAAGPSHVVEMVNITGLITDKSGTSLKTFDLGQFYGVTKGQGTDPRVYYDAESSRFFSAYELLSAGGDEIRIAVSSTTDPLNGSWTLYSVESNTSGTFYDQPKLGFNSDKVTVSWNDYNPNLAGKNFKGVETVVIQKAGVLAANNSVPATFFGADTNHFQVVPVVSLSPTTTQFMVEHNSDRLKVFAITGVPGISTVNSPSPTDVSIGSVTGPPAAAQPTGGDATITTNDARMLSAVWQNGHLWSSFNDQCTPPGDSTTRACLRFNQISTAGSPSLTTNFDLGFKGGDIYFAAVSLDSDGDLFAGFTASSTSLDPTAVAIGEPGGNFPAVTIGAFYASGTTAYSGGRWGDYTAAALDPSNPTDVWVAQQLGGLNLGPGCTQCWSTAIGRFTLTGPTVSGINPTTGPALSTCNPSVTVTGTDFVSGGTSVNFGTVSAAGVTVNTPNQLTALAPTNQPAGTVHVTAITGDGTSATSSADQFTYALNTIPPTTTAALSPIANGAGWNNTNVQVTLTAVDKSCGSGVKSITYSATGDQTIPSTTVAGATASFMLSNEGVTTVSFFSTDNANDVEATKTQTVRIDKTLPIVTYTGNAGTYTVDQTVSITCAASDPVDADGAAASGLASTTCQNIVGPAYSFTLGSNSFSATATDVAGNVGSGSTSFVVKVTFDSLCTLTRRFDTNVANGNGLCANLQAAQLYQQQGNAHGKAAQISAYQRALTGAVRSGYLTNAQATILGSLAASL